MQELVSILIPTYNGAEFILEALESANSQTYKNCEIIISDDNSQDSTLQIIDDFKLKSKFPISVFRHEPSVIGANWNNCVNHANGTYLKFLFQDDLLKPNCIEYLVNKIEEDANTGLVYCRRDFIYSSEAHLEWIKLYGVLHSHWRDFRVTEEVISGKKYLKDRNLFKFPDNKIGEPTAVLLRRSIFDKIGFFRSDLFQLLDVEFWYRAMTYYKVGFVDKNLVYFRLHDAQTTKVNLANGINDYHNFFHIFYRNYFKFLHPYLQWKLIWRVTRLRKISGIFKKRG